MSGQRRKWQTNTEPAHERRDKLIIDSKKIHQGLTLRISHLFRVEVRYDGIWQEKDQGVTVVQSKAISAYFTSKQILSYGFAQGLADP